MKSVIRVMSFSKIFDTIRAGVKWGHAHQFVHAYSHAGAFGYVLTYKCV